MRKTTNTGSYFDGGMLELVVVYLGMAVISIFTLGLGFPWAMCLYLRYQVNHTVIEGNRLHFIGTGGSLFWQWLKWWFLTLITFGIYGFWVTIKLEQWKTEHTVYAEAATAWTSY